MFKTIFVCLLKAFNDLGELQSTHLYTDFANIDFRKDNELYEITIKCKKVE